MHLLGEGAAATSYRAVDRDDAVDRALDLVGDGGVGDEQPFAGGGDDRLHRLGVPRPVEHAWQVLMCDQAFLDRHDVMRTVTTQTGPAGLVHGERHPGSPAEIIRLDSLDLALPGQAGQTVELLAHDGREQPSLARR